MVKNTVLKSLVAIGSAQEAKFYTNLFRDLPPEKFALIVIDPRCLKNPLLESLISDLKILSNLDLTPVLLVGALDDDKTSVQFQGQRLCRELDNVSISYDRRNCASYQFIPDVRAIAKSGRFPVLEITEARGMGLKELVLELEPAKVIFLQPSGGFRIDGRRLPVVNLDRVDKLISGGDLSKGQVRFIDIVKDLSAKLEFHCTYVMASPLNLLTELFTVKGSGTLLRKGATISFHGGYENCDLLSLKASIESAFEQTLISDYFERPVSSMFLEERLRGGAIISNLAGLSYLNKFWVVREAQGEGIARDIWRNLLENEPSFFWRSKMSNPFNDWYMKMCDGMQISGEWRVFWKGLEAPEIPSAIQAAANAPVDFK